MKIRTKSALFLVSLLNGYIGAQQVKVDPFSKLEQLDMPSPNLLESSTHQEEKHIVESGTESRGLEGLDTLTIEEGGNWLLKRQALEQVVELIEGIGRIFGDILVVAGNFRVEYNKLENEYNSFVSSVGFDIGNIDNFLSNLIDSLELERKKEGDLIEGERELENQIEQKRAEVKQLQESVTKIRGLQAKHADVLVTVDQQVELSQGYQNDAWKNFQIMKKILNDEKAEELYYRTEILLKNIKATYQYLKGSLFTYFNEQADILKAEMNSVEKMLNSLKEKGIDLKKEIDREEQAAEEKIKYELEKEREAEIKKDAEMKQQEEQDQQKKKSIFQYFFDYFFKFFRSIAQIFGK